MTPADEQPGPRRCRRPRGDAGVAAVLVLSMAAVLALVGSLSASVAAVAVARQRAAAAADLSALAAAARAVDGEATACARAGAVATANAARLTTCGLDGDQAWVTAEVRPPGALGWLGSTGATARAGPVG